LVFGQTVRRSEACVCQYWRIRAAPGYKLLVSASRGCIWQLVLRSQNWPRAIEAYEKAIALGADNSDVRTDLGNAYRFSDRPQKALEQYEIAQKQNPRHENSLFNQGGLYAFSLNQPEKALEIWREYLARFPQSPNASKTRELIFEVEVPQSDQRSEVARWLKNRTQPTPTPSVHSN